MVEEGEVEVEDGTRFSRVRMLYTGDDRWGRILLRSGGAGIGARHIRDGMDRTRTSQGRNNGLDRRGSCNPGHRRSPLSVWVLHRAMEFNLFH